MAYSIIFFLSLICIYIIIAIITAVILTIQQFELDEPQALIILNLILKQMLKF